MVPTATAASRSAPVLAWMLAGAVAATCAAAVLVSGPAGQPGWRLVLLPPLWALPGALIAAGRPRGLIGWLMLAVAAQFGGVALATAWLHSGNTDGAAWAAWFADRAAAYLVPCALAVLLLLPDGRLPSRRWRPVAGVALAGQVLVVTVWSLVRGPAAAPDTSLPVSSALPNPVGVLPASWGETVAGLDGWLLQAPMLLAVLAIVDRLRRSSEDQRHRLLSVLLAAAVFVLLVVGGGYLWPAVSDALDVAATALLAATLTAAVLRRRMREVEVVVNHAFVFSVLTALIALGYAGTVAVVGTLVSPVGAGVVTGVVALAVLPLRGLLQRAVETAMYGDARRPHAAVRRLTETVGTATTLEDVAAGLAQATAASLRATWSEVTVDGTTATVGSLPDGPVVRLPLASGERPVGSLAVGFRRGRDVGSRDRALIEDLADHGSRAVHAVLLAQELQAKRQQLVSSREEERSRLRRDLHDELGPTLAGMAMQLSSLPEVVQTDPAIAVERLGRLETAARRALEDVRRLSRGLRPPVLDELGLVGALEQAARDTGLRLTIDLPAPLPVLPPAVEVAAYRIGAEAMLNAARHAGVTTAGLALSVVDEALVLRVTDTGRGIPAGPGEVAPGVGIVAMRERAAELGGALAIRSCHAGGTEVEARLPCGTPPESATQSERGSPR